MYELALNNVTLVDPDNGVWCGSIGMSDGIIATISEDVLSGDTAIDATGLLAFPGLVDPHTHFGMKGNVTEDFQASTRAAIRGGVTSALVFFRTGHPYKETLEPFIEQARAGSLIDFGIHCGLLTPEHLAEIPWLIEHGVTSFKFYMGYKGFEKARYGSSQAMDDGFFVDVIAALTPYRDKVVLAVHCENPELTARYRHSISPQGTQFLDRFNQENPPDAEAEAIWKAAFLSNRGGVPLYVVHLSSAEGASAVRQLKNLPSKRPMWVETCPHYLVTDTSNRFGPMAAVLPPLRAPGDNEVLWEEVLSGAICTVGSDHCSYQRSEKVTEDGQLVPQAFGFGEVGHTLSLLLEEGRRQRQMPLADIARCTSRNSAKIFGLYPSKGSLRPGADADIVLVDLEQEWSLPLPDLDMSIYEGRTVTGLPVMTIKGGRVVAQGLTLNSGAKLGRYLHRG